MNGRTLRSTRHARPSLEGLEERKLMASAKAFGPDGTPINDKDILRYFTQLKNHVPLSDRRIAYTTPQGTQVQVTLLGLGSLAGTTVDTNGALNIVYTGTNSSSKIVGHTFGGTGYAPLASIRDKGVGPNDPTAVGSEVVNVVNLSKFNLVSSGYINLMGGVGTLSLASMASDSQIHMTGMTPTVTASSNASNTTLAVTSTNTGVLSQVPSTSPTNTGSSVTTTATTSVTSVTSTATASSSIPNSLAVRAAGSVISIPTITGTSRATALGNAQIFGYDPTANTLIRFDTVTGVALQTIAMPFAAGSAISGVGLGRNGRELVALVGTGTTVYAFDAVSGAAVGSFSTASLAASGLTVVDGIGSSDTTTLVSDSAAGTTGLIQRINVTASLASGSAVAIGPVYTPGREFEISGGLTGVAGADNIYATGAARFDQFQPDMIQSGVIGITVQYNNPLIETSRNPILTAGLPVNVGPPGSVHTSPTQALGSVGPYLARVSGVSNGKNTVQLLTTSSLASAGTIQLNDPNRLAGLSESFHPEFVGAAIVNVTGAVRSFNSHQATGLALSITGATNLVKLDSAADTVVLAAPLNHVQIPRRSNVQLISTSARGPLGKSTRDGVQVKTSMRALGQLTLPS